MVINIEYIYHWYLCNFNLDFSYVWNNPCFVNESIGILKESLKILRGLLETVNRRGTDNTMTIRK